MLAKQQLATTTTETETERERDLARLTWKVNFFDVYVQSTAYFSVTSVTTMFIYRTCHHSKRKVY